MRWKSHVRFGGRAGETDRAKTRHRAPARPDTYVPTWSGMAFTAFVSDVFSRRIVGWRTAGSMPTSLPLDALDMALWTREQAGHTNDHRQLPGLVHHSDAGAQLGFRGWSQHRLWEVTVGHRGGLRRACGSRASCAAGR